MTLVTQTLSDAIWNGTLSFEQPASTYSMREWTTDSTVASSLQVGQIVVSATVPAFGFASTFSMLPE